MQASYETKGTLCGKSVIRILLLGGCQYVPLLSERRISMADRWWQSAKCVASGCWSQFFAMYMHTCTRTYIQAYVDTYTHLANACIHTYIHAQIQTNIHTYIHTCVHADLHAYIHTDSQTDACLYA